MRTIDRFMCIYMYKLEQHLEKNKDNLMEVSFQSDEANTDRPLKEYLKKEIESSFSSIPKDTDINSLFFEGISFNNISDLTTIKINRVLLPEDLTDEIRDKIQFSKQSVYTNPDICLEIILDNKIHYQTIELKSTKNNSIPGSSIQQINPEEWVIFIRHQKENIHISTGQYIHAINSKMQFPDRSPRPEVSFNAISKWNKEYRLVENNTLRYQKDDDDINKKALITDWQDVLSKRWINMLFNTKNIKPKEPWFNNNLRKFIISFLSKYEQLNDNEKKEFKNKIKTMIQNNSD